MKYRFHLPARLFALALGLLPCVQPLAEVTELDWDALIPAEWSPADILADLNVDALDDNDPAAQEAMARLEALWREAPVVPELAGKRVKLPGFVVPLDMNAKSIKQFLLVPYYGACIHVPPPPANQTVHVITAADAAFAGALYDTVWVTGTIRVEETTTELAQAGYRLEDAQVEPYE